MITEPDICDAAAATAVCHARLLPMLAGWAHPRPVDFITADAGSTDWQSIADGLRDGGILLALTAEKPRTPPNRWFRYVDCYQVRLVDGVLVSSADQRDAKIARISSGAGGLWLVVCSDLPPPPLPQGLLESASVPAPPPVQAPAIAPPSDRKLIALAERMMAMESRVVAADFRASQLEYRLSQTWSGRDGGADGGFFDVPRERHEWKLAEHPAASADALAPYDRRPDDAVIVEARKGADFFARWDLFGDDPDFAGAARDLESAAPTPVIELDAPVVSIVIPVYGQLAYTLNCLHSLLRHKTCHLIEIIVIDDFGPDRTAEFLPSFPHIRYHRRSENGGFIASCNDGAARARGQFLVLLNNDTRLVEGWLDALIESFTRFPQAGLIGSKLHYEDGTLQEAGGIIWRDGSCWNYGWKDDPNRPQYSHARQADYISGCSIAIRMNLWREVGGFDAHYAPAYGEDADLGLRLIERGHQIWFQPLSRVVHYEGKTSGTDTSSGVKAFQPVNAKKLYLRWRNRLLDHRNNGNAPYFERERSVRQRLLVIDATTPTPNQDAGSVQTMLALRAAQELGYKVHFVSEDNWLFDPAATPALQAMGIDCGYAPYELGLENYLRRYGFLFDAVLVYRVTIFERSIDAIQKYAPQATLLFHVADLHHLRMARQAALEHDSSLAAQAEKMKHRELALARRAHGTITHSRHEAELLAAQAPEAQVTLWPLMLDFHGTKVDYAARRDVCFLGNYRHPPNADAVLFFVAEVWPLLRDQLGCKFIIAGANPTTDVLALSAPDVIVTGQIDDLRDLFDRVRVSVVPLRVGAGVKGKVMTALSYGVPVVSTAIGVEGTDLMPELDVLVADTPAEMAVQILRLYRSEELWNRLSEAGQNIMRERFSPRAGAAALAQAIDRATHRRLGFDAPAQSS